MKYTWWLPVLIFAGCAGAPAPREPAAPISLAVTAMDGSVVDLDAALARGETVALVFWQTWCESCKSEAPAVAEAARTHGSRIRFVGVVPGKDETVDDAEVRKVTASWAYDAFPQVRDRDLGLSREFDIRGTPTILVLGKGRRVLFSGHRAPKDWTTLRGLEISAALPDGSASGCKDGVCPLPVGDAP